MMKLVVLCLAFAAVYCQTCAPSYKNDGENVFGSDQSYVGDKSEESAQDTKERHQAEEEMKAVLGSDVVGDMASSAKCAVPNELPAVTKPSIKPNYWWYYWKQGCEPCPPNAKYLHKYYGNSCFVIFPYWQQVRVAKCSYKPCGSPCGCANSKCLPTAYTRIWFFGWCNKPIGGWQKGFSYHYLYLPQDCTCHQQIFYPVKPVIKG